MKLKTKKQMRQEIYRELKSSINNIDWNYKNLVLQGKKDSALLLDHVKNALEAMKQLENLEKGQTNNE
jgi:hypothetical protein